MLSLFIRQKKSQIKINWKLYQCAIFPKYFVILLNSLLQKRRIKYKINHLYRWKKNIYLFRNVTYESCLPFTKISPFFVCCVYTTNDIDLFQQTHCIRMKRVDTAEATACSPRQACKRCDTYSKYVYVHTTKIQGQTLAIGTTAIYKARIFPFKISKENLG